MKPTLIDIASIKPNGEYYDRTRDMEVALAWNAIKKTLEENHGEHLFPYIKSVRLTDRSIVITTGKPAVNKELMNYREEILRRLDTTSKTQGKTLRIL